MLSLLISLIFLLNTGFAQPMSDSDNDGIPDSTDLCPKIPASNSKKGCPIFYARPNSNNQTNTVHVQWTAKREDLLIREKTEIKLDDVFWAIIRNPKTEEIFSKSKTMKVTH